MRQLCLLLALVSGAASAQVISSDTTWSGTVNLDRDVVVNAGVTLTVSAGTTINVTTTDAANLGSTVGKVELIVNGTMNVNGTGASVVTFTSAGTSAGSWIGLRVGTGGALSVTSALIEEATSAIDVTSGTATVTGSTLRNNTYGVRTTAGMTSIATSLISGNSEGVYFQGGTVTVDHSTLVTNSEAIYATASSGSLNVTNSVLTNNGYGFYRSGSLTIANSYNDVWGNTSNNYYQTTAGTGSITSNPLYVGTGLTPYRLTSNSPARKGDSVGGDMGAFAYVSDATSGLTGVLWSPVTLATATVTGDLVIPAGVTVTVPAGVTLTAATTDVMQANSDVARVEIIVRGTLDVTSATLTTLGASAGAWIGVRVEAGGTLTASGMTVEKAGTAIEVPAAGNATVTGSTIRNNTYGVRTTAGSLSLGTSLISGNSEGVYFQGGTVTVDHSTLVTNSEAIYATASSGSLNVTNSVLTNNGYGFYRSGSLTISNSYNDVWGNTSNNYYQTTAGTGSITSNPLYVGTGLTPYRLTSNSPARRSDSTGTDMGAFPYTSDATSGLTGVLWSPVTLSTATITGDLIIPAGVTVTVPAGVTLSANTTDVMQANSDVARVEVIVRGTLNVTGATLTTSGASAGAWIGVRVEAGGTLTASGMTVEKAGTAIEVPAAGNATVTGSTIRNNTYGVRTTAGSLSLGTSLISGNSEGVYFQGGTVTVDHSTLVTNSEAIYATASSGSLNVTNSVLTNNGYGFYRSGSLTIANSYNDVWGNTSNNYYQTTAGTGSITSNPLYVGTGMTPYRLTSNSPARRSDSTGGDMGAFPYTSDATSSLTGVLWSPVTLSTATVTGDLIIPAGVTVTVPAGVTLTAATTDLMQANSDVARVEIIVRGTLSVTGATLTTLGASAGAWIGVRVEAGGTLTASGMLVEKAGTAIEVPAAGNATVTGSTIRNNTYGVRTTAGSLSLGTSLVSGNSEGIYFQGGTVTVDHSTLVTNSEAIYSTASSGSLNVTNSVLTNNGYGFYRSGSLTIGNSYNDVWGNTSNNYYQTTAGTGSITSNPLYVSTGMTPYRLTSNSPARNSDSTGGDMGAFPYVADATSGLLGTIWTSMTISSSQTLAGDLIVPVGVTVTLAPGVVLTAATTDQMQANSDVNRVELIVRGTLSVNAAANPVVLTSSGASAGAWTGVRVESSGSAVLTGITVSKAGTAVEVVGNASLSDCALSGNTYGVRTTAGSTSVTRCLISGNSEGVYFQGGTVTVDHSTFVTNSEAIYATASSGSLNVTNSVLTNNGYGFYRSGSLTIANSYNDVWGNTSNNYYQTTAGTGSITSNPLYVGTGMTPYRLTSNSPARRSDSTGGDMGAFPFVSDPTIGLTGVLWADTTLSSSATVVGDLTVPTGVTVTIAPGVTLTAATTDVMQANSDVSRVELIVRGTLQVSGTPAMPVVLTTSGASAGAWTGVIVQTGGSATLTSTTLNKGNICLDLNGNATVQNSRFSGCSTGVRATTGTHAFSFSVFDANSTGYQFSGGTSTLDHLTSYLNSTHVYATASSGSVNVTNSIFQGGSYALYRSGTTTIANSYNLFFNSPLYQTTQGASSLTVDPLLVAPASGDFRLQSTSPARGAGTSASDLGAFPFAPGPVDRVVISPTSTTVAAGATVTFTATAYDATNNPVPSATFTWSALTNAGVINSSGVLTASCTPGSVTGGVTVSSNGKSASANLTITVGPVASLAVSPSNVTVRSQASQQFTVMALDTCNNPVASPAISWSATGSVGIIDGAGLYTAGCARGSYPMAIVATAGSVSGRASVTVDPGLLNNVSLSPTSATIAANGMRQFTGSANDGCGNPLTTMVSWSTNISGANVNSTGLLTVGTTPGTFTSGLTASATEGMVTRTASANITVTGGAVASVMVMPATATLNAAGTANFSAVALDSFGNMIAGTPTWSVVAMGGSINGSTGAFTAGTTAGTFTNTVRATISGVSGFATVIVNPGPVTRVTVSPATVTVAPMGTTTFTATAFDANNNVVNAAIAWSATSTAGSITQGGVFTAGTMSGTYNAAVTATVGSVSGTANVTINAGALSQVVVTPAVATTQAGGTVAFSATGRDGNGNTVAVTPIWSVVSGGGTINTMGVFTAGTATGTFTNTVRAESNGVTGFATVSVTAGPLVRITVTPAMVDLLEGTTQQFAGTGADAFGNAVPVSLTWSANAMAGAITSGGLFTAGSMAGDYPTGVTATSGSVSGTASVRVRSLVMMDAGMDAGVMDAGTLDAGMDDAGMMVMTDAGMMMMENDGGMIIPLPDAGMPGDTHGVTTCGCQSVDAMFGALGLLVLTLRRRRRN